MPNTRKAAILGGNRIPFARSNGAYAKASNQDLLTAALDGLVDRFGLGGERLGEVAGGAVVKLARDINLTRESVLGTKLAPETPAYDVGQACGTGLETTILVANKIAARPGRLGRSPAAPTRPRTRRSPSATSCARVFTEINAARCNVDRLKALTKLRPAMPLDIPKNAEPRTGLSMGEHTAIMAKEWGLTRAEQDELAVASHRAPRRRLRPRLPRRPRHPLPRARARRQPAPRLDGREARQAAARSSAAPRGR